MSELFDTVLHALEGEETRTVVWQTSDGPQTEQRKTFGPDRWIERVHGGGRMSAIECLALVLFAVRDDFNRDTERHIVEQWADALRKAAAAGEIKARDPRSLLPLDAPPEGWDWFVSLDDADKFVTARGMGWTCSERAAHIHAQCAQEAPARLPEAAPAAGVAWPPERIAEARAMRDSLKRAGHRDYMARTAEHEGVTPQRLRKVLGPDPARAPTPTLASWPTRKVHRLK